MTAMVKITPMPTTDWRVELGAGEQPFSFPSKAQAIAFAVAWADLHQPGEVGVFDKDGALQRTITFPNGNHRHQTRKDRRQAQIDMPFADRRRQERRSQV